MDRREFLAGLGGGLAVTTAGCLSQESASSSRDLPSQRTHKLNDWVTHESVRVAMTRIGWAHSANYHDRDAGSIETWNPGDGRMIVVADFKAEALGDEEKPIPRWDNFSLTTPGETVAPTLETPDGTSVQEFTENGDLPVPINVDAAGVSPDFTLFWSAVFEVPRVELSSLATKWSVPESQPIYWLAQT